MLMKDDNECAGSIDYFDFSLLSCSLCNWFVFSLAHLPDPPRHSELCETAEFKPTATALYADDWG
jgi:hypothetical protein